MGERMRVWESQALIARGKAAEVGGRPRSPLFGQRWAHPYWMLGKAAKKQLERLKWHPGPRLGWLPSCPECVPLDPQSCSSL